MHPRLVTPSGWRGSSATVESTSRRTDACCATASGRAPAEQGITHLLISPPRCHRRRARGGHGRARGSRPRSPHRPAMALHAATWNGLSVTIVRANVDHLCRTALAVAKGFSKINFQFTALRRAWRTWCPRWRKRRTSHARDRSVCERDRHPRHQRASSASSRGTSATSSATCRSSVGDVFARIRAFPSSESLPMARRAREKRASVRNVVDDGCEGFQCSRGEARHAARTDRP